MTRFPILVVFNLFIINLPLAANAAGGPVAKNFGAQDWLDKIHIVLSVVGIVAVTTAVLLLFFGAFILHVVTVNGASILIMMNETLGRVLAICGINGVYVTEKPAYMFPLYVTYIFLMIIVSCTITFLLQKFLSEIMLKK